MLEITVFGASDSVGKSCVMISDGDRRLLLDAGIQLHPRRTGLLSTPPEGVDQFSEEIIKKFAKTERMSKTRLICFKLMQKIGIANFYWNSQLKKNNAYEKCFARPFEAK